MNNNNRIHLPGEASVQYHWTRTPVSTPTDIVQMNPQTGDVKVTVFGGLSVLEWMSGMVASSGTCGTAEGIVDSAQAIIEECQRRQSGAGSQEP